MCPDCFSTTLGVSGALADNSTADGQDLTSTANVVTSPLFPMVISVELI